MTVMVGISMGPKIVSLQIDPEKIVKLLDREEKQLTKLLPVPVLRLISQMTVTYLYAVQMQQ